MRMLVLGGTAWLGRCVATVGRAGGHQVTCLARAQSGTPPEGVEFVRADRTQADAYRTIADGPWDVVLDVSRHPGQVRGAVEALVGSAGHFVFVSSGSVYAAHTTAGQTEAGEHLPPLPGDTMESMDVYGEAKVACEDHVRRVFGEDRSLIARVGLIGGPGDESGRTGYWPWRFANPSTPGGAVLVPDTPDLPTQVIDVRDLAAWLVDAAERSVGGTFNVTGPTIAFAEHIETARRVSGHEGPVVRADPAWLIEQGVNEWMGARSLPLWLTDPAWFGFNANDSSRACAEGLVTRPLDDTLRDVLGWELARGQGTERRSGLRDDEEAMLLSALHPAR